MLWSRRRHRWCKLSETEPLIQQTAKILSWMATKRPRFDDFASRLPLLTAGNSLLQTANPPCCLLPLEAWHEKLQQFVDVIPDSGRLASIYWLAAGGAASESLKPALVAWNICCSDFLTVGPHTPEGELIEKVSGRMTRRLQVRGSSTQSNGGAEFLYSVRSSGKLAPTKIKAAEIPFVSIDCCNPPSRLPLARPLSGDTGFSRLRGVVRVEVRPAEWLARIRRDAWVPFTDARSRKASCRSP